MPCRFNFGSRRVELGDALTVVGRDGIDVRGKVRAQHTFSFRLYRLDVANQQLWRGEEAVPLRPKTFAVLRYLVE
jgi:DNA-binding response OmpR family regulator